MWQELLQHGKGFIVEFCRRLRGADRRAFQAEVATDDVAREHRSRRPITICTPRRSWFPWGFWKWTRGSCSLAWDGARKQATSLRMVSRTGG